MSIQKCIVRCLAFVEIALPWTGNPDLKHDLPGCIDNLFIRHKEGFKKVAVSSIQYIKASGSYCEVHLTDGSTLVVSVPLSEVVSQLSCENFIRIHRSFSINLLHLDCFVGNTLVMEGGTKLPIGREYRKAVIGNFMLVGTKSRKYVL